MTPAKATLGRYLFYDKRMSINGRESCASCHKQELAFTDGRATAAGATGEFHPRSAMSLVNVAYANSLTWSNPNLKNLEEQIQTPMFGVSPLELGLKNQAYDFLRMARADRVYDPMFRAAFPAEFDPFTSGNLAKAIASFERSIISARSPYDRYHYRGEENAIPESAKRGEVLFFIDGATSCFRCHGGFNFSDATSFEGTNGRTILHNTGLYNVDGPWSYPAPNLGAYEHTKRLKDVGKFKAPTLRNIALTAPYMHDGSVATLDDVLTHYAAGGRTLLEGPHAGRGQDNPNKDKLIGGFYLSRQNRMDLIAFLKSLTDDALIHDPRFANPWDHPAP